MQGLISWRESAVVDKTLETHVRQTRLAVLAQLEIHTVGHPLVDSSHAHVTNRKSYSIRRNSRRRLYSMGRTSSSIH